MPTVPTWKRALSAAISAELEAEQTAVAAEDARRSTWWATTWALAEVPRSEWGDAQALYIQRTKQSIGHAKERRSVGARFSQSRLGTTLPQPRFAQEASRWVRGNPDEDKLAEAVKLLADAEESEMSLREFSQMLTGKPWTKTAENLTEADEDAIVEKVARKRPERLADVVEKSDPVRREVTRRATKRNEEHRTKIKEQIKPLAETAEKIREHYEETETGTSDPTLQSIIHLIRDAHMAETVWAMNGGNADADLVNALSELQSVIDDWRKRVTGSGSVEISENDRAWADELGIDLGVI